MSEQTSNLISPTDLELARLSEKVDGLSECVAGLKPILEDLRNEIKQVQISQASFMATSKANDDNLDKRISKVENVNNVWNVLNTIGATIAAAISFRP